MFAVIEKFCRGTQFRVNKDKSAVLTSAFIDGYKCTNVIKVLGFYIGTDEEAEMRNQMKIEADIRSARKFFNRHASLRGKALIMGSFVLPKVLYVARHMKQTLSIQKRFDQFSMDAIWGNGRKKEIALKYLQRTPKDGGIQWPNISAHIAASKTMDFKNSMMSTDVATKKMMAQIWQHSPRRIAFKMAPVKINEITENSITIKYKDNSLTVFGDTKYKDVYTWCCQNNHHSADWEKRMTKSKGLFGVEGEQIKKCLDWLWKQKCLTAAQKNIFFKFVYNCYKDKDLMWDKGLKPHPICFLCNEFENISHLFEQCEGTRRFLHVIGVNTMHDILLDFTVLKVKVCVCILYGSWNEESSATVFQLQFLCCA